MIHQVVCPLVVGREEELSRLEDALLAANRGDSRFVVLTAEAGMGKTRLAVELRSRAERIGCTVLWGGCSEAELALPYLPLLEALGNYLATQEPVRLTERLGAAAQELAQLFPQLGPRGSGLPTADPSQTKLRLFESMVELLAIAARETGVLLVIEDLHWADSSTRELLDYLARRVRNLRIMVLVTYRSDELHRRHPLLPTIQSWRRSGLAEVIELQEMASSDVGRMIEAIFDSRELAMEFRELMHARAEGNPFVLEEMLKDALDRGDIFRDNGAWRRRPVADLRLPDTVRDTILLRLERLDGQQIKVLQSAAVVGRSFDYHTLAQVAELDEPLVQSALEAAVREQLLEEDPRSLGRYRFRHALTQEAIYGEIVTPRRQQIHSRTADVLRASGGASFDLGQHLLGAGRYEEAIPVCIAGGDQAMRTYALREAVRIYERALEHIRDETVRGEVLCKMGEALWRNGESRAAEDHLEEGVSLLQRLDQERLAAPYLLTRGRCKWERARPDLAAEDYERARAILEPQGPSRELAAAYIRIAGLAAFQLDDRGCVEAAMKAVKFAKQVGATDVYAWALGFVGLGLIGGGEVDRGLSKMVEAFEAAKGVDYAIASNTAWNEVWTRVHLMAPGIQEALDRLEEADRAALSGRIVARTYVRKAFGDLVGMYDDARKAHSALLQANAVKMAWRAALSAAEALAEMGRFDEAAGYLPEASSRTEVQDLIYDCGARVRYHLGSGEIEGAVDEAEEILEHRKALAQYAFVPACGVEVFATVGRLDDAKTLVESMLNRSHPYGEGCVEVSRARLALVKGDLDGARKLASSASTHFQRVGFKLEELRARTLLGEAIARLGDRDAGGRELAAVLDEALAINARLIADDALRRAAEAGIDLVGSIAGTEAPPATAAREVPSLPGERLVTVMFADVRGYTAMTAASSPKEVSDKIATLQRWAKHEIERHGGVVDKFAGDAVMATFNFSGATIDHCEHAFQAALALRDKGRLIGLPLGIGIAVGPAIVGALAAGGNLSVLGETTNLAARLQSAAQGGEILLSEEAAGRVRDLVKRSGGETVAEQLSVKGLDDPVAIVRFR